MKRNIIYISVINIICVSLLQATSTTTALYRLGEDDLGAAAGGSAHNPSKAAVGEDIPLVGGSPFYAPGNLSELAITFDGDDYYNLNQDLLIFIELEMQHYLMLDHFTQ